MEEELRLHFNILFWHVHFIRLGYCPFISAQIYVIVIVHEGSVVPIPPLIIECAIMVPMIRK